MKHNIRSEMRKSTDALTFSQEQKRDMIHRLTVQAGRQRIPKKKRCRSKLPFIALAAALVLATLTGAAVYTRWSSSAQGSYKPSQQIREQAEKSGLSVMLEETKGTENPSEVLTVTDQGITVTAVQSIVDNYRGMLVFRVEGFDLPEAGRPAAFFDGYPTIDGSWQFWEGAWAGRFDDGLYFSRDGYTYADGSPAKTDENGDYVEAYQAPDGSLEYVISFSFRGNGADYFGKEFEIRFTGFGQDADVAKAVSETTKTVEGNWTLRWILTGTDQNLVAQPDLEISDGHIVKEVEITPLTIRAVVQTNGYYDGWETLEHYPPSIKGVRTKDGQILLCASPASEGYVDQEQLLYEMHASSSQILDVANIDAIVLHKGWEQNADGETVQLYQFVPVG